MIGVLEHVDAVMSCVSCRCDIRPYTAIVAGIERTCWPEGDDGKGGKLCSDCYARSLAGRESARRERAQADAGIPPRYRSVSWRERDQRVVQPQAEQESMFVARVHEGRGTDARVLGLSVADREALRAIARWQPHMGSIFVEGPAGTGKTLAVCALANDLVSRPVEYRCMCEACEAAWREVVADVDGTAVWQGVPQERHYRGGGRPAQLRVTGPVGVRFVDEPALIGSMRGPQEDGQAAKESLMDVCKRARVLFFDDLGNTEALKDWHKDALLELLNFRYNATRPTLPVVFSSNLALPLLDKRYGERFASRVREMVGPRNYVLTTSWRPPKGRT